MKVVRIILFILNVILALGMVLTTLAGYVSPTKSIYPSLVAFGYPMLLGVNVLAAVLWLLFGRWEFLLSVGAIALRYAFIPLFIQVGGTSQIPSADEHPKMVSMMSYNVHLFQGNDPVTATPADSNAREFLALVREYNPDVLCLQEYEKIKKVSVTDSLVLMGYSHFYSSSGDAVRNPRGEVVFSKLPITFVKRVDATKVLVELLKDESAFRLLCVHLDSYRFDNADRAEIEKMRHGEVEESSRRTFSKVKETIQEHEQEWNTLLKPIVTECSLPLVMAGDMNDIPSSYLYHQITKELSDCYTDKGVGFSTTYNGGFPRYRIDMVFRSEGIRTLSYKRVRTDISDHYPLVVSFELEEQ